MSKELKEGDEVTLTVTGTVKAVGNEGDKQSHVQIQTANGVLNDVAIADVKVAPASKKKADKE